MPLLISGGAKFDGFEGFSLAVLFLACGAAILWAIIFAWRWFATFPYQPAAGPTTNELGGEAPAIVNLLVHRCALTRAAIAATVLDLAARGMLAVEEYGTQVVIRVRDHRIEGQALAAYEHRVLEHIRRHATGGSAPIEALGFDSPSESESFWDRFRKDVVSEARRLKLVRSRWAPRDWTVLGGFLAAALGLFASAFALAHLGEGTGGSDDFGRWDWYWVAGIGWVVIMAGLGALRDLRDTPAGRDAAARWLGVRAYLREAEAFEDSPAASVTVWDRYLAYGAALGVAHEAVRAMPFDDEDPGSAWSRYGGHWREIDVRYPMRFSFGQAPFRVFLEGAARSAFWGFIGFFILPISVRFLVDLRSDLLSTGIGDGGGFYAFIVIIAAAVAFFGILVALNLLGGLIRLWRGAADLGKPVVLEGEVVKLHIGRVAVDDGNIEEATGWLPPMGAPAVRRGTKVRVTRSRRLWHVYKVEVLANAPEPAPLAGFEPEPTPEVPLATAIGGLVGMLRASSGFPFAPAGVAPEPPRHAYTPEMTEGGVAVHRMPLSGFGGRGAAALLTRTARQHGEPIDGLGADAWWMDGRVLIVHAPSEIVSIDASASGENADARREAAIDAAKGILREAAG